MADPSRRLIALAGLATLLAGVPAAAEEQAVLRDGRALRCTTHRVEGPLVVLELGGGSVTLPSTQIVRFEIVPDLPASVPDGSPVPQAGPPSGASPTPGGAVCVGPEGTGARSNGSDGGSGDPAVPNAATDQAVLAAGCAPDAPAGAVALMLPAAQPASPLGAARSTDENTAEMTRRIAEEFSVDPRLVEAVIHVESRWNPKALSPKGAGGLMQLMPKTADRFDVQDVFDPADNIRGGVRYLKWLLDRFDGDLAKVLAAYNAGEGAVDRHLGIPPYRETRRYVLAVLERYVEALRKSAATAG